MITIVAILTIATLAGAMAFLQEIGAKDDRGKNVHFDKPPTRIVSLGSSFTEIIVELDEGDRIVGVDYSSTPDKIRGVPKNVIDLGKPSSLSMETLLNLRPDCVIIWNFGMYENLITDMEKRGLKVVAYYPKTIDETFVLMERIGDILGIDASPMVNSLTDRMNVVLEKTANIPDNKRTRIYLELASMEGQTVGGGTLSNQLIELAGGKNIFADGTGNFMANDESIKDRDPQVIVVENSSKFETAHFYDKYGITEAAKDKRIHRIAAGTLTTSPRLVEALEDLACWLHPDLFEEPI